MIQIRRGKTNSWKNAKPLADGQPGYDKETHKLKIGDGNKSWDELPSASGLRMDEILVSESAAKDKSPSGVLKRIANALKLTGKPIITYGEETPNESTIGQIYLQHYDAEPQVDYVVSSGRDREWIYQKRHSGVAECYGTFTLTTTVNQAHEGSGLFYSNNTLVNIEYPFIFKDTPSESATLHSSGSLAWLANKGANSKNTTSSYKIISLDSVSNSVNYKITIQVKGYWK